MITKLVEYSVKKSSLTIVLGAVKKFVSEIQLNEVDTFYEVYQINDSLDFVHLMKFSNPTDEKKHANASYTDEFVKILYPLCTKEPKFIDLKRIKGGDN